MRKFYRTRCTLLAAALICGCAGPQIEANPEWTPAVVIVTPTLGLGETAGTPTPLDIPTTTYRIRPGETLTQIADRYGLTVDELARLNGIQNPNLVEVGQEIKVPR